MGNWNIHASACYDMGSVRENNEDAYYFNGQFAPLSDMNRNTVLNTEADAAGSLWAVCDGMGGQSNGEKASFTAISGMPDLQEHLRGRDFETTVRNWVHQANRAVYDHADGGGSTLAMLYCTDHFIQTAHVGDSRIYRYHDGVLSRITKDHSKVEMLLETKMITPEEARNHPQKNVITRYLGMNPDYICEATIGKKIPFCSGDRFLLCSDGASDMLTDEELSNILTENTDVSDCVSEIREAIFDAGARDNFTVILLEMAASEHGDTDYTGQVFLFDDADDDETTVDDNEITQDH